MIICSPPSPCPDLDLDDIDRGVPPPRHLVGNILPPHIRLVLQGQHDGADHGDQQNDAGGLEVVDVARYRARARALWVLLMSLAGGIGAVMAWRRQARSPTRTPRSKARSKARRDQRADRQIIQHALRSSAKSTSSIIHDEQEQHGDGRRHKRRSGSSPETRRLISNEQAGRQFDEGEDEKTAPKCTGLRETMTINGPRRCTTPAKR